VAVSADSVFMVEEPSQVPAVRRAAADLACRLGFDEATVGRVALAVTEAATNLVKHAAGGAILLRAVAEGGAPCVEMMALDRGRGMASVSQCLADGYSTAGSAGTGLGAIRRLASLFDVYSRPDQGTALLARVAGGPPARTSSEVDIAGVSFAKPGEVVCGDTWAQERRVGGATILVADGLGHGAGAAEAAATSERAFSRTRGLPLRERLDAIHDALRPTRGAAVAVVDLDVGEATVRFAGIGNVAGSLHTPDGTARQFVSHNGTAGHAARRVEAYTYPWPRDGVVILHTDGLATVRGLDTYPGLLARRPALVAAVLYRDLARGRDDVTVVVARHAPRGGDTA
jgi:anti-sigma regulatory factor (Ser/Thr protein kinase)